MKSINSLRDLEQYGIYPLTGEADNLSFRTLCEVDMRGYKILCEVWGMRYTPTADLTQTPPGWAENWNSGGKYPHIASVMISEHMIEPISIIALLTVGNCHTAITVEPDPKWHSPGTIGLQNDESYTHAPFDCESGKYTGPAMVNLDHFGEREWSDCYGKVKRVFTIGNHPHRGTRNVHAMSGRAH